MTEQAVSILAVDDEETNLEALRHILTTEGYHVDTAPDGLAAINMLQMVPFDLILLDIMMPGVDGLEVLKYAKSQGLEAEIVMVSALQDVKTVVECMKLGAFYYTTKPYQIPDLLALVDRALERKNLASRNRALKSELARRARSANIITRDRKFLAVIDIASRAAPTDCPVLIQGPSGTGKELVANYLHANSPRREEAFVALNCSSLPENLIESELFGHEKGAFTSASSRKEGLVQLADGGTLFLDEIAELAMILQPKLLRFLQTGEYRRIGGNGSLRSDVRVIAATNADLRDAVAEKRFREDLLFRLNVITLQLPSLKERKDDIPLLVDHFLAGLAGIKTPKRIEPEVLDVMMKYEWPGNVRELENVIRRAALLAPEETISPDLLALPAGPAGISRRQQGISPANKLSQRALTLNELQRAYVIEVLDSVGWDVKLAAKILGMRAQTLYARMRAYHLKKPT